MRLKTSTLLAGLAIVAVGAIADSAFNPAAAATRVSHATQTEVRFEEFQRTASRRTQQSHRGSGRRDFVRHILAQSPRV